MRAAGGTYPVAGARGQVDRLLALTSMEQVITLVTDVQPALSQLRRAVTDSPSDR